MHPNEASRQIAEIRQRMAWSQTFRGFASLAVAFSSLLAFVGGAVQGRLIPSPRDGLDGYIALWAVVAALSLAAACLGVWTWMRRARSELARARALHAIGQIAPCLAVGALLTYFVHRGAQEAGWMLPGLWSLVFALAVFASRPMLSREVTWVGAYYVVAGSACLVLGDGDQAYAPWQMTLSFGGGQLLGAAVLYWTVERTE